MRNCFALITERHFSWWAELSPKRSNTCNLWSQQKRYFKSVPLLNQLYSNTKYKKKFFKSPPLIGALLISFAFHEYLNVLQCCCCSVTKWCLTLSNPMDCSMPGFPVHHQLPELAQTHVQRVGDAIQPSHPLLIVPFSSCLQSLPASGSFLMSRLFESGGQSIGASALASVLPMNIQEWFPLGWTGWISLQSKGLSRVFSNTTVQKSQFFSAQPSSQSNFHIHTWPQEKP